MNGTTVRFERVSLHEFEANYAWLLIFKLNGQALERQLAALRLDYRQSEVKRKSAMMAVEGRRDYWLLKEATMISQIQKTVIIPESLLQ